jgi:hypothetical protein
MPNIQFNYNKSINGFKDSRIKGLGTEVSALIEDGMKDSASRKSAISFLFNEVKSNKATERIAVEDGYDLMDPQADGDNAKTDKTNEIGHKDISHVIYTKNVMVTETMMEDAYYSMDPSIELQARAIPDSYWRTRETVAQGAYINGEQKAFKYKGAPIDLTTYDGKPLFSALVMGIGAYGIHRGLSALLGLVLGERAYLVNLLALVPAIAGAVVLYFFVLIRIGTLSEEDILAFPAGGRLLALFKRLGWIRKKTSRKETKK